MQLAATWEFIGWEGNPNAPQRSTPWTSIYAEESLELAREPGQSEAPATAAEEPLELAREPGQSSQASAETSPDLGASTAGKADRQEATPGAPAEAGAKEEAPATPAAATPGETLAAALRTLEQPSEAASVSAASTTTAAPSSPGNEPAVAALAAGPATVQKPAPAPSPQPASTPPLPLLSLEEAVNVLARASRYDVIGSTLFDFCRGRFERVLLMTVRYRTAMVIRGFGPGTQGQALAALRIDLEQPSIFKNAGSLRAPVVISFPTSEQEIEFFAAFADPPAEGVVLPVVQGDELIDLLYADCGPNTLPVSAMDELTRLTEAAAAAHERSKAGST